MRKIIITALILGLAFFGLLEVGSVFSQQVISQVSLEKKNVDKDERDIERNCFFEELEKEIAKLKLKIEQEKPESPQLAGLKEKLEVLEKELFLKKLECEREKKERIEPERKELKEKEFEKKEKVSKEKILFQKEQREFSPQKIEIKEIKEKKVAPLPKKPLLKMEKQKEVLRPERVCELEDIFLREINQLIKKAQVAEEKGDYELAKKIKEKIESLKERFEERKKECQKLISFRKIKTPAPIGIIKPKELREIEQEKDFRKKICERETEIAKKIEYYKDLVSLAPVELKKKGYQSKLEITRILEELEKEKAKLYALCKGKKIEKTIILKPVAPERAEEITIYYKEKVADIMEKSLSVEEKINQLKEIKKEIDKLITELIRRKKEISLKEVQQFTEKVILAPGKVKIGETEVKPVQPKIIKLNLKNKEVEMEIEKDKITIEQEGIKAKTSLSVEIKEDKVLVEKSPINLTPKEIIDSLKVKPLEIELAKEKEKPVYKIKTVARKRLFFIFPIRVKKEIIVDAQKEAVEKIKEKKPWWSIFAF